MKPFLTFIALLLFTAVSLQAQTAPDAPELTRLLNEFLAGAGRSDAEVHDRFWADDLIYTRSAGSRTNKPDLMKGVRSAPAAKPGDPVTVYTGEDVRIQQYGNAAVVAFKLVGTSTKTDGTKSVSNHLNTGTFIKRNGKWQVVAWQATMIPKPESGTKAVAEPKTADVKTTALISTNSATTAPVKTSSTRTYLKGLRGGCYYLNTSGNTVYVDKGYCG